MEMTLVCRRCHRAAENETGSSQIRCPACGVSGDRNQVIKAAQEYLARTTSHDIIGGLQDRLAATAARSKSVTYTRGKLPSLSPPGFILQ